MSAQFRRTGIPQYQAENRLNLGVMALSYVRIETREVVIRRGPRPVQRVPRQDVERFAVLQSKGEDGVSSPRLGIKEPHDYLALLLKDGGSIRLPSNDQEPAAEALSLNNQLLN